MSPLLNYTTQIEAAKTVGEIQKTLVAHGAKSILIDYGDDGTVEALAFQVITPQGEVGIRLPIEPTATLRVLERQWQSGKIPRRYVAKDQAIRIAWRIIKDWVEAQMAILETEMVKMEQIFLPYVITPGGKTLYEHMVDSKFLLTTGASSDAKR